MMKSTGESSDGPTDAVGYWWGDAYGEGPRMFFRGFKAVPEWAPPRENHILYSKTVLKNVAYAPTNVQYTATDQQGTEYLRLTFLPNTVTANGTSLSLLPTLDAEGYTVRVLGGGDYAVTIRRARAGDVVVSGTSTPADTTPPTVSLTAPASGATVSGNTIVSASADDPESSILSVAFYLDSTTLIGTDTNRGDGWGVAWNTTLTTNASHTVTALATNGVGLTTISGGVTVTVYNAPTAPSITTHPANQTATVGSTATFSVGASGTPPLSYQWQKNGVDISGATASTYTTPALALSDSGSTYRVTVTNSAGSVPSNAATLTVIEGPLPFASYNMNEASGTTLTDRSGNSRNGTLINGPTWTTGKNSGGLSFDGTNDYVTLGTQALPPHFTLSAWVNNPTVQTYESLFSFGTNREFSITQGFLAYWNGSGFEYRFGAVPIPTGSWQHVAFTYDGNTLRAYLNGTPWGNALTQNVPTTSGLTFLGAWPTTSNTPDDFFSGTLDDVRIYDTALTQAQIQNDMNTPVGGTTPPAVLTVFSDTFESSLSWTTSGDVTWYTGTPRNGTHSVRLRQTGSITKTIPTTGYNNIAVSFAMGAYSLDNDTEYVVAEYYDGSSWISLARIDNGTANENNRLNPYTFTLPSTVSNLSSFALRFRIVASSTNDYGYVDDLTVLGTN